MWNYIRFREKHEVLNRSHTSLPGRKKKRTRQVGGNIVNLHLNALFFFKSFFSSRSFILLFNSTPSHSVLKSDKTEILKIKGKNINKFTDQSIHAFLFLVLGFIFKENAILNLRIRYCHPASLHFPRSQSLLPFPPINFPPIICFVRSCKKKSKQKVKKLSDLI